MLALVLLQAQGYCGRPMKYGGMWDVLQQTVRKEGVRGLYKASARLRFPPRACKLGRRVCLALTECCCCSGRPAVLEGAVPAAGKA